MVWYDDDINSGSRGMANEEISVQSVKIYQYVVANVGKWVSAGEVASSTGVAGRTARFHLAKGSCTNLPCNGG